MLFVLGLVALYIIVAYIFILLYEKRISLAKIRIGLILGLAGYFAFTIDRPWSSQELWIMGIIFLAHISVIPTSAVSKKKDSTDSDPGHKKRSNLLHWIAGFILLSWLFDDDDEAD